MPTQAAPASSFWENWKAGYAYLYRSALEKYQASIEQDPEKFRPTTEAFLRQLVEIRQGLDRIKPTLPREAKSPEDLKRVAEYNRMAVRYHELAEPFYKGTQTVNGAQTGLAWVLVIGALAISSAAVAWSIPAYQYAENLVEQTRLASRELDARDQASRDGRTLQPSTLPQEESILPPALKGGKGLALLGILGLGAYFVVPQLLPKKPGTDTKSGTKTETKAG